PEAADKVEISQGTQKVRFAQDPRTECRIHRDRRDAIEHHVGPVDDLVRTAPHAAHGPFGGVEYPVAHAVTVRAEPWSGENVVRGDIREVAEPQPIRALDLLV